jgi:hypothetical protein
MSRRMGFLPAPPLPPARRLVRSRLGLPVPVLVALATALVFAAAPGRAAAGDPPYLKLAEALGAPHHADSNGPPDKSYLQLKFVPDGESADKFTKLVTISILKVPATRAATEAAARGVIVRLRDGLKDRHADIQTFDESPIPPVTLFYEFSGDGDVSKGVVYCPMAGFVTAAQIDAKNGGHVTDDDVAILKKLLVSIPH